MTVDVEQDIREAVNEIKGDVKEMKAALFGSDYSKGRLPELESTVREHGKRLNQLERFQLKVAGAFALALILFEAAMHLLPHH